MKHEYVIPDCPYCGDEMTVISPPPAPESITKRNPYGHRLYRFVCQNCNAASPLVERGDALNVALKWAEEERGKTHEQ